MPPLRRFAPSPREGDAPGGLAEPVPWVRWPRVAPVLKVPRGFTLIELLVAISVMALIAILSWRGLDGMVRAQESTRQRADEMLVLQAALGQWGTDLDALVSIANTTLNQTGQAIEGIMIIMAAYLTVSLSISIFMNWYNKRIALVER